MKKKICLRKFCNQFLFEATQMNGAPGTPGIDAPWSTYSPRFQAQLLKVRTRPSFHCAWTFHTPKILLSAALRAAAGRKAVRKVCRLPAVCKKMSGECCKATP